MHLSLETGPSFARTLCAPGGVILGGKFLLSREMLGWGSGGLGWCCQQVTILRAGGQI